MTKEEVTEDLPSSSLDVSGTHSRLWLCTALLLLLEVVVMVVDEECTTGSTQLRAAGRGLLSLRSWLRRSGDLSSRLWPYDGGTDGCRNG
jgi:hypothetical protein